MRSEPTLIATPSRRSASLERLASTMNDVRAAMSIVACGTAGGRGVLRAKRPRLNGAVRGAHVQVFAARSRQSLVRSVRDELAVSHVAVTCASRAWRLWSWRRRGAPAVQASGASQRGRCAVLQHGVPCRSTEQRVATQRGSLQRDAATQRRTSRVPARAVSLRGGCVLVLHT